MSIRPGAVSLAILRTRAIARLRLSSPTNTSPHAFPKSSSRVTTDPSASSSNRSTFITIGSTFALPPGPSTRRRAGLTWSGPVSKSAREARSESFSIRAPPRARLLDDQMIIRTSSSHTALPNTTHEGSSFWGSKAMRLRQLYISLLIGVGTLALTACGGGDVSSASSVPPPTPTPTPTPTSAQSVTIFGSPVVGQYASVGASATGHPWTAGAGTPVGPVSTADADQVHIRYTGSGTYEVQLTGGAWNALIPYGQGTGPNILQGPLGISQLAISGSRDKGYQYSEL